MKRKLRNLVYGKKPHADRVIYEVEEGRQSLRVLDLRRGARRKLQPSGLDSAAEPARKRGCGTIGKATVRNSPTPATSSKEV